MNEPGRFTPEPLNPVAVEAVLGLLPQLEAAERPLSRPPPTEGGAIRIEANVEQRILHELRRALYDANLIQSFDWSAWQEVAEGYFETPERLATADLGVIVRLLTLHARKDRFCDGHLGSMCDCGHLQAILRRLRDLWSDGMAGR